MSGEGLVKACWKNKGSEMGYIGLTPNIPATIIPVNLDAEGGSIKCKRDAFMAALNPDTKLSISMLNSNSCAACCCSGMDVFMQDIRGSGMVRFYVTLEIRQAPSTHPIPFLYYLTPFIAFWLRFTVFVCRILCCRNLLLFARGQVFIQGHGTIMEKELASGEEIVVDTNS